jgi:hypothetical protein
VSLAGAGVARGRGANLNKTHKGFAQTRLCAMRSTPAAREFRDSEGNRFEETRPPHSRAAAMALSKGKLPMRTLGGEGRLQDAAHLYREGRWKGRRTCKGPRPRPKSRARFRSAKRQAAKRQHSPYFVAFLLGLRRLRR